MGYISIGSRVSGSNDVWSTSLETFSLASDGFGDEMVLPSLNPVASVLPIVSSTPTFTESVQSDPIGEKYRYPGRWEWILVSFHQFLLTCPKNC